MAKRFTDNEKWKDAWFMDLPAKYKLFWLYILDDCSNAGIWKVNFKVASFFVGDNLEYSEVKRILKDRITILDDKYWFINKFVNFQYKCEIQELNVRNKAHLSVIKQLNDYDYFKPLTSPLLGVKDKDKDKEKDKEEEKEKIKPKKSNYDIDLNNPKLPEDSSEYLSDDILYQQKQFLMLWNKARVVFKVAKVSNISSYDNIGDLKTICRKYNVTEIKNAIAGLMRQKGEVLPYIKKMPGHFLKLHNFEGYLDDQKNGNFETYGNKKKQFKQQEL